MLKKLLIFLFCLLLSIPSSTSLPHQQEIIPADEFSSDVINETPIGTLWIPRISLKQSFYDKNSSENTIEKHVSVLKESSSPSQENSLLLLAAHSGTGNIAYFEELDQIEIGDSIEIVYEGKTYSYLVSSIWEEEKNGYIHIPNEEGRKLVLTTCSPKKKNYQLILYCLEDI